MQKEHSNGRLTLEQIEQEQRGVTALLSQATGVTGKIAYHLSGEPGNAKVTLELSGNLADMNYAYALLALGSAPKQ